MIRSSFRGERNSERGFALIIALVLAVLYFGLIELLMYDASRELAEARRFRGRIVALTLAENGAELAAARMITMPKDAPPETDWQGTMSGKISVNLAGEFDLRGEGQSTGREGASAKVRIEGVITGNQIHINFSRHSQ